MVGTSLYYGRPEFVDFNTRPTLSDVPIQPGETYTFKIPDDFQRGWEVHKLREHRPDPKKIEILFAELSFADGTGFDGTDGKPFPFKREQSTGPCREGPLPPRANGGMSEAPGDLLFPSERTCSVRKPAAFLPVIFLPWDRFS